MHRVNPTATLEDFEKIDIRVGASHKLDGKMAIQGYQMETPRSDGIASFHNSSRRDA